MNTLAATLALLAAVSFALAATPWQRAVLGLSGISLRYPRSLVLPARAGESEPGEPEPEAPMSAVAQVFA